MPDYDKDWKANTPSTYRTPLFVGQNFYFVSAHTIFPYYHSQSGEANTYYQRITYNGKIYENTYLLAQTFGGSGEDIGFELNLDSLGAIEVFYSFKYHDSTGLLGGTVNREMTATYNFKVIENRLPLKKWTVTEVLNRLFDIAEPIRKGEKPRFRLQGVKSDGTFEKGSQAEKFDKILAPEFSFTKQTLRECLKQVGGFIHGEPRLSAKKDEEGDWYFEVAYDMYGGVEQWKSANRPYVASTEAFTLKDFATAVDTNPENLINKINDSSGRIVEPYLGGYKSVRTDQMYVQITESNMLIPTQFPIYSVEKLECRFPTDSAYEDADITDWLFEASVYNAQLSSYDSQYPYSKAYGLMYKQGERNITALNFKQEHPISDVFERYAIINIIRAATGNDALVGLNNYPKILFRVTYTPFYDARVKQVKMNYTECETTGTMIYNQSSNVVESRAFGENLKGVAARLGNIDRSRTYMFSRLGMIPRAGMKLDDDYYISGVYTEILPAFIRCTVALTKDFNRISQFVGIPSYKRYSQISQSMAVERNVMYEEYVVIGDSSVESDADSSLKKLFMDTVRNAFLQDEQDIFRPVDNVTAWGESYGDGAIASVVNLPVIVAAYGTSIAFTWEYLDNYSAGAASTYKTGTGDYSSVKGYFQTDIPYTDYYGRIYYYHFSLLNMPPLPNDDGDRPFGLPGGVEKPSVGAGLITTYAGKPFILRKDNREKIHCNMQVHFVTNRKGLIIGSALAEYASCVRTPNSALRAMLYVLPRKISKFAGKLSSEGIDLDALQGEEISLEKSMTSGTFSIRLYHGTFAADGEAWVIATKQTKGAERTVENEKGEIYTVSEVIGGDLLLAQNMPIKKGDLFEPIFFTKKRDVFRRDVWKDCL